jgi:hypothetical protein
LNPYWVARRLKRLAWRYAGGTGTDVGFDAAFPFIYNDPEKELQNLYSRITGMVRYLRQSVDWAWELTHEEAQRWETALEELIRAETGGGASPTPQRIPFHDPWGFGDYDGGG